MSDLEVTQHHESEVQTPVSAEAAIDFCINQLKRAPGIITECLERYQALKQAYDFKAAKVADGVDGTEMAKKRAATLACVEEREAMDAAYTAYQYAKARTRALEKELSGRQSVNSSVKTAYNTSGWRS